MRKWRLAGSDPADSLLLAVTLALTCAANGVQARRGESHNPLRVSIHAAAAALIFALWVTPVNAQSTPQEKVYQWSLVAAGAVHVADLTVTQACLTRGTCREANPALRWASDSPAGLGLAKGALAGTVHLVIHRALWKKGHRWQAIVANVVVIGVTAGVTRRNTRF